jgi:hypothetical protein
LEDEQPSEVAGLSSWSASSSCTKNPLSPADPWKSPTTMAWIVTVCPVRGDVLPLPWIEEINVRPVSLSSMVTVAVPLAAV